MNPAALTVLSRDAVIWWAARALDLDGRKEAGWRFPSVDALTVREWAAIEALRNGRAQAAEQERREREKATARQNAEADLRRQLG